MKTTLSGICSLEGDELAERARQWAALRTEALRAAQRTDTGARFEYTRSRPVEEKLEELVRAEQECCVADGMVWSVEKSESTLALCVTIPGSLRGSKETDLILAVLGGV